MKLQIGRFGLELTSGEVESASTSGSSLTLKGVTAYANLEQSMALRQQLLGYVDNPDEDFVPVTWAEYPAFDGFYRVTGVSVDAKRGLGPIGKIAFSVSLDRVQGYAAPLIEDTVIGKTRLNSLSADGLSWVGLPSGARSFVEYAAGSFFPGHAGQRVTEGGAVNIYRGVHDSCIAQYFVAPESFYDGAATLNIGENLRNVAGRQIENTPDAWELTNGLLQVRPVPGATTLKLQFRQWNGTLWSVWRTLELRSANSALPPYLPFPAPHSITVMRNSPEIVVLRLVTTSDGDRPVNLDLTVRRGGRTVAAQLIAVVPRYYKALVSDLASATPVAGGLTKTLSSGAAGDVMVFGSPISVMVTDVGADALIGPGASSTPASVDEWAFGFGLTNTVDDFDSFWSDRIALREYFWAGTERQSVVAQ